MRKFPAISRETICRTRSHAVCLALTRLEEFFAKYIRAHGAAVEVALPHIAAQAMHNAVAFLAFHTFNPVSYTQLDVDKRQNKYNA